MYMSVWKYFSIGNKFDERKVEQLLNQMEGLC